MDTTLLGIAIALFLGTALVNLLSARVGAYLLLFSGGCALLGGLAEWMFGGVLKAWDNSVGGGAMQQRGLIIALLGLLALIVASGLLKRLQPQE